MSCFHMFSANSEQCSAIKLSLTIIQQFGVFTFLVNFKKLVILFIVVVQAKGCVLLIVSNFPLQ